MTLFTKKVSQEKKKDFFLLYWQEILLTAAGIFILIFFFVFLYNTIWEDKGISAYLPIKNTVGFVTVAVDEKNEGLQALKQIVQKTNSGSLLLPLLENDFEKEIQPLLGKTASVAMLENGEKKISPVLLVSVKNRQEAKSFIQKKWNNEKEIPFEKYESSNLMNITIQGNTVYMTEIDTYLVLGQNSNDIKNIIDVAQGRAERLYGSAQWSYIRKNLPSSSFIFAYIDYAKGIQQLEQILSFQKEYRDLFTVFKPLTNDVSSVGIVVDVKDGQEQKDWYVKTIVFGAKDLFEPLVSSGVSSPLWQYLTKDTIFSLEGKNFLSGMKKVLQRFGTLSSESEIVLEGLINYYLHRYVAHNITLFDIADLNSAEYGFALYGIPDSKQAGLFGFLNLKNEAKAKDFMHTIFGNFTRDSEFLYTPEIREFVLPDKTVGKELYLEPKNVKQEQETWQGADIFYLTVYNDLFSPGYMIQDGKLYVFSHYSLFKQLLEGNYSRMNDNTSLQGDMKGSSMWNKILPALGLKVESLLNVSSTLQQNFSLTFLDEGLILEQLFSFDSGK